MSERNVKTYVNLFILFFYSVGLIEFMLTFKVTSFFFQSKNVILWK